MGIIDDRCEEDRWTDDDDVLLFGMLVCKAWVVG